VRSSKLLCICLILLAYGGASAQKEDKQDSLDMPAKHAIKVNLLQFLSFYGAVPLAYEFRVARHLSVQVEGAWVYNTSSYSHDYANKRGTKIRTALRWYAPNLTRDVRTHDYLSLEPYANIINFDRQYSRTECFDVECQLQFRRLYNSLVRYRESGVAIKWGHISYGRHLLYDVNLGVRLRRIRY
jgi:hypothetical protein